MGLRHAKKGSTISEAWEIIGRSAGNESEKEISLWWSEIRWGKPYMTIFPTFE
jgi:hypothetical protein